MVRERPPRLHLLMWLRSISLMAQPPLLPKEGCTLGEFIHSHSRKNRRSQTAATVISPASLRLRRLSSLPLELRKGCCPNRNSLRDRRAQISDRWSSSTALLQTRVWSRSKDPRRGIDNASCRQPRV